ncbi:MFS transporter [Metabacillus halosaccharovorans]|uniref:MFS transporter n=1 Tax=Metabacillus halosaccharovorans TaxID=930124 RepID=UPI0020422FF4|nr:MFS transporter [Metabacillus halosaccharovorans]MCM3439828.1 MFS transporter [Metabacillus halosaccharovorans]
MKRYSKNFLILFSGQTISNLGNQIYLIALPWLVYELTHSSFDMGTISAIMALPDLLFALIFGTIIDRYNRKRILWIASFIQLVIVLIIPLLFFTDMLEIYHIYITGFLYSTATLIFITCYRSCIPDLTDEDSLVEVNSLIQLSLTIIKMIGPLLAGLLIANFGIVESFMVDAFTYFLLIICIFNTKLPNEKVRKKNTFFFDDLRNGITYTLGSQILRYLIWLVLIVNIGMSIALSLMVFHLRADGNLSAHQVGYVYSISGIFSLVFTLLAPKIARKMGSMSAISLACMISGLGLLFIPFTQNIILKGITLGLITGGGTLGAIYINSMLQKQVPSEYLGRVFATTQMISRVSVPLALVVGGWGSETRFGVSGMFVISSLIVILSSLGFYLKMNMMNESKRKGEIQV